MTYNTQMKMTSSPIKVAVSGAAGNIGYALLPLIASGYIFGNTQPIELRLLEIPHAIKSLEGTRMELEDCAYPCLRDVVCTTDPLVAFNNADVIVLVGGFPRKKGMARKDLIQANTSIFSSMGQAISDVASSNVKVLVVANPANTNCLVALTECTSRIPTKNFCALTYLDHQRAKAQIAKQIGGVPSRVHNVTIWGNHSETQYPDMLSDGYYVNEDGTRASLKSIFSNDMEWTMNGFVNIVQNRGKEVINARGSSSALSAAMSTADCLKIWLVTGTNDGDTISMAVYNDKGYYGVQKGIVFSFPCECQNGEWSVKENLELNEFARQKLKETEEELLEEREAAHGIVDKSITSQRKPRSISNVSSTTSLATSQSEMSLSTFEDSMHSSSYMASKI